MRKLFFIVCCTLALDICLAEEWWKSNFIIGAHWGPPLQYNENGQLTRDFNLLKEGGFNFTLGQFSPHNTRTDTFVARHINSLIQECIVNEILFLNDTADYTAGRHIENGVNIKDEPFIGDTTIWLEYVSQVKEDNADWLGFINLFPSYADTFHNNFNNWKEYVDAYLGDTTLQVACFDNYSPNSNFLSYRPSKRNNYYSNITYLKHAAGSRPLWVNLRSSEKYLEEKDTTWQDAYLRIGAFAPLAFGAKGIIYFSYDCMDRNRVRRGYGRQGWGDHDLYFDNDERDRQIFFGNFKYDNNSNYQDLAIHTNENIGTWYIKETVAGSDSTQNMVKIGSWFGDQASSIPNVYNWDFASDGRDKFTTITRDGRLLLSMFRSGWTHKAIINVPWSHWSTMNRYTCPFGDFNGNQKLDLCLGWTENRQGKLRIYMDCEDNPVQDPSTTITDMSFNNNPQTFTFSNPIRHIFTRNDSIWVITSNPADTIDSQYKHTDGVCLIKYDFINHQFDSVYNGRITLKLATKIEHYWMEDSLYAQDEEGNIWKGIYGQAYNLTNKLKHFGAHSNYVWGQYNTRTHNYDRYCIAPEERYGYQTYALLDRKGRPNRIYQTAKAINQFINDSINHIDNNTINSVIMDGEWVGAYFTSRPSQSILDSIKIIKKEYRGDSIPNPLPLINPDYTLSDRVLFGLFTDIYDNLDLLIINMQDSARNVKFTFNRVYNDKSYSWDKITRMYPVENTQPDVHTNYTKIILNNMLGGECAILRLTKTSTQ